MLSGSQLNKLKSATKNETGVTLRLPSNMIDSANDVTNFPHILLVANKQIKNLQSFAKNFSITRADKFAKCNFPVAAITKFSKTHISKLIQSEGSFGRLPGSLTKVGLSF